MASNSLSDVPSSPLSSLASMSPSPPPELASFVFNSYPSPSSSQRSSAMTTPAPEPPVATPPSCDDDSSPPRKKRKLAEPKPRTTERLDMRLGEVDPSEQAQLDRLLKVLHKKRKIVVIAGAGISVSAGIPDFRSSTGLFKSLRKQHNLKSTGKDLFDASVYQDNSSTASFHDMVRSLSEKTKSAEPTAFHHLLATLAHEGRLLRLYSQNVDGIDTSLEPLQTVVPLPKKAPWPKTIQLHGGLDKMVCSKCNTLSDFKAELFEGPVPPPCNECEDRDVARAAADQRCRGIGRLRPRMVLYNEHNPDDEAIGSVAQLDLRTRPDAVIVAGTTLKVPGVRRIAREMCAVVRGRRDGMTVWINNDPEPMGKDLENVWDIVVQGPCDEVARHAAMRRWDDSTEYKEVTDEEMRRAKEQNKARVVVFSPSKKNKAFEQVQGQLVTPVASPRQSSPAERPIKEEATPTKKRKAPAPSTLPAKSVKPKTVGAAPKKRPTKSKKAATTKGAKKETTKRITTVFTVSKAANKQSGKTKKDMSENIEVSPSKTKAPSKVRLSIKRSASLPMAPLSPQAARNNTSPPHNPPALVSSSAIKSVEPETINVALASEVIVATPPAMDYRKGGTISPTGSLPRDLRRLIDIEP